MALSIELEDKRRRKQYQKADLPFKSMLTKEDLQNILVFLTRVQISGNESTLHAVLLQKLKTLLESSKEKSPDEK